MIARFARPGIALAAALSVVALSAQLAFADARNFTFINLSPSTTVTHLYVSTSDTQSWEEDVLGKDVLAPGETWDITFSKYDGDGGKCLYDVKVIDKAGADSYLYKVDLCSTNTISYGSPT